MNKKIISILGILFLGILFTYGAFIKKDVMGAVQHDRYNIAGKYSATAPTLSNGEQELLQLDASGNLKVKLTDGIIATSAVVCLAPETCQFQADGTADDVQIQAAIDSLPNGGLVYIKAGTYDIATRTVILTSDIKVQGDGQGTKLVLANNVNMEIFVVGNAVASVNNVDFYDLYLDGNKANNSTACSYTGCTKNLIRYRSDAQNSYGGVVSNVYATNGSQNGISFESHAYCTVTECVATNNDNFGIWAENGSNFNIINNFTATNTMAGIKVLSAGGVVIANNNSKGDFGAGIALQSVSGVVSNNVIYRAGWSSTHQNVANGLSLSICSNLNVIGNNIYGAYGHGMSLNQVTESTFIGNIFERNGQKTDDTYSDIRLVNTTGANTLNSFIGNTFNNATTTYYDYRVKYNISADASDVHVNNIFSDNIFGTASTSIISALDIDGGGSVKGNTFGFNQNLNPNGYYSYAYCGGTQILDPVKGDFLRCAGYESTTTLSIANGVFEGQKVTFKFDQDAGGKKIDWAANILLAGGAVTLSSSAGDTDMFQFIWDGTNWIETSRSLDVN